MPKSPLERGEHSWFGLERAAQLFNYMEGALKIRLKSKRLIQLRFNYVQERLAQHVAWCWAMRQPIYLLIPKFRQGGVSTWVQGFFHGLAHFEPGFKAVTVAHTDESSELIFGYTKTFERHLAQQWRLPFETRQAGCYAWNNDSMVYVGSSKAGDALGKGGTLQAAHFSEVANFADNNMDPNLMFTSAMGALAKEGEEVLILESTAKGRDPFFYDLVEKSLRGENEFFTLFFPWYLDPLYAQDWSEFRRKALLNPARRDPGARFEENDEETILRLELAGLTVTPENRLHVYPWKLTEEQLVWRRSRIAVDCNGSTDVFRRYYPSTLRDAFSASEACAFSADTLNRYFAAACEPIATGSLRDVAGAVTAEGGEDAPVGVDTSKVELHKGTGALRIWEYPIPGEEYVIGADPSAGLGGKRADASAAYVVAKYRAKIVAAYHDLVEEDVFSEVLHRLGRYYNMALLAVENNATGVAQRLAKEPLEYPNLYWQQSNLLLPGKPRVPGWSTNRKTRIYLVEAITTMARNGEMVSHDAGLAREMESFVWHERRQRYEAAGGKHDDRVVAASIALYLCPTVDDRKEHVVAATSPTSRILAELAERRDRMRERGLAMSDEMMLL